MSEERCPGGRATRLLIVQFMQLQRAGLDQLTAAAAEADGKVLGDGLRLDMQTGDWVRERAVRQRAAKKKPEAPSGA